MNDRRFEEFEEILEQVKLLLEQESPELESFLRNLHVPQLAKLLTELPSEDMVKVFRALDSDIATEVIGDLEDPTIRDLLPELQPSEISDLVSDMDSDEAADILSEMDDKDAEQILTMIDAEDSDDVRELMAYPETSAGGIMATEMLVVPKNASVGNVIDFIRRELDEEDIYEYHNIFIVDGEGVLLGQLPIQRLLVANTDVPISEIMDIKLITVTPAMDQEHVAQIFRDYDLLSLPVVDDDKHLVGKITIDDIMDVVKDEAMEDIAALSGTDPDEIHEASLWRVSGLRLPWLVIGLLGGIIAATVMGKYKTSIYEILAVSFFVPVITSMAGTVGLQVSTTIVQAMAIGKLRPHKILHRLGRELIVNMINALMLALLLVLVVSFWFHNIRLGISIALALVGAILGSAAFSTIIPMSLKRMGIDPAIAMGPFITILNDITGLFIYLSIITGLLTWISA